MLSTTETYKDVPSWTIEKHKNKIITGNFDDSIFQISLVDETVEEDPLDILLFDQLGFCFSVWVNSYRFQVPLQYTHWSLWRGL